MARSLAFDVNVTSNADEVAEIMARLGQRLAQEAQAAALNRTAAAGLTQIRKNTSAETGVPSKVVGSRMKLHRANRNRSTARIFIGVIPVAAYKAGARQLKSGVSFAGGKGKGRVKLASGFVATMPSGHTGIFQRIGVKRVMTKGRYAGKMREAIDEVRIPIEPAARRHANKFIAVDAPKIFEERYRHEFEFRVQREADRQKK